MKFRAGGLTIGATAFLAGFCLAWMLLPRGKLAVTEPRNATPTAMHSASPLEGSAASTEELTSSFIAATHLSPRDWSLRVQDLIGTITPENAQAIAEAVRLAPGGNTGTVSRIVGAWARNDPSAAMKYAEQLPEKFRRMAVPAAFSEWARIDRAAAGQWLQTVKRLNERARLQGDLISAVAESDPEEALQMSVDLGRVRGEYAAIIANLARSNPERAVEKLEELPQGQFRKAATLQLGMAWSRSDPAAAMAWAESQKDEQTRIDLMDNIASAWVSQDFKPAFEWLSRLPPGLQRSNIATNMIATIAPSSPENAIELVDFVGSRSKQDERLGVIASEWAQLDPAAVKLWASQQSDPSVRAAVYQGYVSGLGGENPSAAIADATTFLTGSARREAIKDIVLHWADLEPEAASKWAGSLPAGDVRSAVFPTIADMWGDANPEAALQWARSLPADPAKFRAIWEALGSLANTNPVAASRFVSDLPPGEYHDDVIDDIAGHWGELDPPQAVKWASALPAGESREAAVGTILSQWSKQDAKAAFGWLQSLPAGADRDNLIPAFSEHLVETDPALAIQLVSSISDTEARESYLEDTLKTWIESDVSGARKWIDQSNLDPAFKKRLLSQ